MSLHAPKIEKGATARAVPPSQYVYSVLVDLNVLHCIEIGSPPYTRLLMPWCRLSLALQTGLKIYLGDNIVNATSRRVIFPGMPLAGAAAT
jgi:hypothetical protein